MSLRTEIEDLRHSLAQLVQEADSDLVKRYALKKPPPRRLSPYRRTRMFVGRILRRFGFLTEPWLPGLKHVESSEGARPFVIWALGVEQETLRAACRGYQRLQADMPGRVPVLVTDIADFAFFSRLGWLVEYVPDLSTPASGYRARKKRYLAWLYRDAPALPVAAGLREDVKVEDLLID